MGACSVKPSKYPAPHAIAQTIRHEGTSLAGARRFYASARVVVYADERIGMANVAGRTWLGPSATRRISTYLDMVTPGVGGLIMAPAGVQAPQLDVGPQTASARLREMAEAKQQQPLGTHKATLCSIAESPDDEWEWTGILAYDHRFRLKTGQYTTSRPLAVFHVRDDTHPTRAHIVVEIRHADDLERVHAWMAELLPTVERWSVVPFALVDDRHAEVRSLVAAIGAGGEVTVANPQTQKEGTGTAPDAQLAEFVRHMREARYTTSIQGLDSLIERAENVDHAILSAFDLYHWSGEGKTRVAVRVRLRQSGMDPLTITWGSVREPYTASGVPISEAIDLNAEGWDLMTAANWDEDRKMSHLRALWTRVIGTLASGASSQAA
jgi:hypothetical protein